MSETLNEILSRHSLFSLLSEEARKNLLDQGETILFKPGDKLITEGEFNPYLYLLIGGTVEIANSEGTIAMVEGHKILGEISSSGLSSPVADVIAEGDVTTIAFPLEVITDFSLEYPDFGEELRHIGMKRFESPADL